MSQKENLLKKKHKKLPKYRYKKFQKIMQLNNKK